MSRDASSLREVERWLRTSAEEAERVVPMLLGLPAAALNREFRTSPELRTPGVLRCLLRVAHDALDRLPSRAHELTVVVLRYVTTMAVPPGAEAVARIVHGEACREYAAALREIDRPERARRALKKARSLLSSIAGSGWYLATVDVLEAPLLHDLGEDAAALAMIRRAAEQFALFRDEAGFIQARMLEIWMMRAAGDSAAAAELWSSTVLAAERRSNVGIAGRLAARMGVLELRHGNAAEAMELLRLALDLLERASLRDDEVRARRHYAEAAALRGKTPEALSELYRVRRELLSLGHIVQAAAASVDILELLTENGRAIQAPSVARTFVYEFRDAGLPITALEALAYLRERAGSESLTSTDFDAARVFFEDLPQNPFARFVIPP